MALWFSECLRYEPLAWRKGQVPDEQASDTSATG
jgi:hypothetical protein